jgi:hypothetical protein
MAKWFGQCALEESGSCTKAGAYLLLISCSKRKAAVQMKGPAIQIYDGPVYRSLRKRLRSVHASLVDIYIVSAKYGLISATTEIDPYDCQMTKERAIELRETVLAGIQRLVDGRNYKEIFINLGSTYRIVIHGIERFVPADTTLKFASGGIGERTSQTVRWLEQASFDRCQEQEGQEW